MYKHKDFSKMLQIVEARLGNGTSENPIKDLAFLTDRYQHWGEWDKANSASRQMIRVAEGDKNYNYELTPVDIDLVLDKRRYARVLWRSFYRALSIWYSLFGLVFLATAFFSQHPQSVADIFPWYDNAVLARAGFLRAHGEFEAALVKCDQVLARSPNDGKASLLKAAVLFDEGRLADADALVSKVKTSKEAFLLENNILFQQGDLDTICSIDAKAPTVDNPDMMFSALDYLAFCSAVRGDYNRAMHEAEKAEHAAKTAEERSEIELLLARIHVHLGNFKAAECHAAEALKIDLNKGLASLYRAEARVGMGAYESALLDASYAIFQYPHCGRAYAVRAHAFSGLGQAKNAEYSRKMAEFYKSSPAQSL